MHFYELCKNLLSFQKSTTRNPWDKFCQIKAVVLKTSGIQVTSKQTMNVLGLHFDSKLNWQIQVPKAHTNSKSAPRNPPNP